jgi:copper(I)-binding protein
MRLRILFTTLSLSLAFIFPVLADICSVGNLTLSNAWIRPSTSKNTAAYITINNPSLTKDKLLKVECDASKVIELHNHIDEDGVLKMRPVEDISIEDDKVELKPGSLHIMLMDLTKNLKDGETVKMRLVFENAGPVDIDFPVGQPTSTTKTAA